MTSEQHDQASDQEPSTPDLGEPSTEKEPEQEPHQEPAPKADPESKGGSSDEGPDHEAVGIGVVDSETPAAPAD